MMSYPSWLMRNGLVVDMGIGEHPPAILPFLFPSLYEYVCVYIYICVSALKSSVSWYALTEDQDNLVYR